MAIKAKGGTSKLMRKGHRWLPAEKLEGIIARCIIFLPWIWRGCGDGHEARSSGTGSAAFARRAVAAPGREAGGSGAAAQGEPDVGVAVGASARCERTARLAQSAAHRAPAAAERSQEEAAARGAQSRRSGARVFHRSVDAGARRQADQGTQRHKVFGIRRVAAAQEPELVLPASERPRHPAG
jgi:hypothetical protein